jgi:glucosamine-6-phosphate deaminase
LELVIVDDYDAISRAAADRIATCVKTNPAANVVLATGSSPIGAYRDLARRQADGTFDPSRLRVFQLDAYLGLGPDDRRSLYRWLAEAFLDPLGIKPSQVVRLPGDAPDPQAVCKAFDDAVTAAGGFDLSVLGVGMNGHLGFNEPPADPNSHTRVVDLTEASLDSNAEYWGGRDLVPRRAITAGMAGLMAARQTLVLVSGTRKHDILRRTVEGPQTAEVPASFLQGAANVTVIADRAAWDGL